HALLVERQYLAGGSRSAEYAGRARDVPATVVVPRIDGEPDAARGFEADDQRIQEIASRGRHALGESERGGADDTAGVDQRRGMRVAEGKHVGAHAVDECCVREVELFGAAEDASST